MQDIFRVSLTTSHYMYYSTRTRIELSNEALPQARREVCLDSVDWNGGMNWTGMEWWNEVLK